VPVRTGRSKAGWAAFAVTTMAAHGFAGPSSPTEPPRIWTWDAPLGDAAGHPAFTRLVQVFVSPDMSVTNAQQTASAAANAIRSSNLPSDRIAIILRNWGKRLAYHPADAISPGFGLSEAQRAHVPWTTNGRAAATAWTAAFIARFRAEQKAGGVPDPSRFHMDNELWMPPPCFPNPGYSPLEPCWGVAPVQVFAGMTADPRWDGLPLPWPGSSGRTLASLHAEASGPTFDPSLPRSDPANRAWAMWYEGTCRTALEAATHETLYTPLKAAWPAVRTSDFSASVRIDGGAEPDGSIRGYADFEAWGFGWFRIPRIEGMADLQAPALYLFGEAFVAPDEDWWKQNLALDRANLDACIHSFGGPVDGMLAHPITPWLTLPGVWLPWSPTAYRSLDLGQFRELLALLRSRGIDEFQLWPGVNAAIWNGVAAAVDAVWTGGIGGVSVTVGTAGTGDPVSLVHRAYRDPLEVTPAEGLASLVVTWTGDSTPPGPCVTAGTIDLAIEAWSAGGGTLTIESATNGSTGGPWRPVATVPLATTPPGAFRAFERSVHGLVGPDGAIRLRLRGEGLSAPLAVDLVQLTQVRGSADLDRDGAVNANDLSTILGSWGPCSGCPADLDGDGIVAAPDLAIVIGSWGQCR